MNSAPDILIVAGEASGDVHGAGLMRELKALHPDARFFGMGGPSMRAEGLEAIYDASEISVMGFAEVVPKLLGIFRVLKGLAAAAETRRPTLAILIDIPDFNLRLAKRLKALAVPVAYYISPMVWAWRKGRIKQIVQYVDTMLCILPFEVEFYRQHGVHAEYVGSPVLEHMPALAEPRIFRERLGLPEAERTVALLPGSRRSEVKRHLPRLAKTAEMLARSHPGLQFVIPVAPSLSREALAAYFTESPVSPHFVTGRAAEVVGASDAAAVCSGTATLEAALMERPMVVVFRTSFVTAFIYWLFIKLKNFSLANLIVGRTVVPELIQYDFTPQRVAGLLEGYLDSPEQRRAAVDGLAEVRGKLGAPGASRRAAEAVDVLLQRR